MRHFLIVSFLILFVAGDAISQRWSRERHHLVIGLGASGFMGDLGGADDIGSTGIQGIKDFDYLALRPALLLGYRYLVFENLGVTGNLGLGYVYGDDKFTEEPFRNNRNINFRSPIIELSSTADLTVWRFNRHGARYRKITRIRALGDLTASLYIFAGVGGFYFNPQGYFERDLYQGNIPIADLPRDGWYNLRPLKTEGQGYFETRKNYTPFSLVIPFGLGGMVYINPDLSLGIRYGFRKTFTDYIDDVSTTYVDPLIYSIMFDDPRKTALAEYFANPTNNSLSKSSTSPGLQRGNPFNTDAYMFAFITLHYRINDSRRLYNRIIF